MVAVVSPDQAVEAVIDALRERTGTRWVGVDGFGASGKSTLAARIAAALPGSAIVAVDDFARPGLRGWDLERFVAQLVEPLLAERAARYQRWDFERDEGTGWLMVPTGVPVIVEGVSATDERLPVPWDLTLWLEAPAEVRWSRILERDGPDRRQLWRDDWLPSEQAYAREQRPMDRVDYIVTGGP